MDNRDATPGTQPCPRPVSTRRSRQPGPPEAHRWIEAKSLDPQTRIDAAHRVQHQILDEGYAVPLYVPQKIVGTTPAVQGWKFDKVGYTDSFYDVWLAP